MYSKYCQRYFGRALSVKNRP